MLLLAWLQERGGYVHPALDLFSELPNGDRGVVATSPIEEGTTLVTCPHALTLHVPTAEQLADSSPSSSVPGLEAWRYLTKEHPGTSPFLSTVLVLQSEIARGDASTLHPYLARLPEGCGNCLLSWTEEQKEELKGTSIEATGESPEEVFHREVAPRMAGCPQLWPAPYDTLPQFLRVAGLVQSRAFHMEAQNWVTGAQQEGSDLFLIPAIDMINHSTDPLLRNTTLHSFVVGEPGSSGSGSGAAAPGSSSGGGSSSAVPGPFFSMKAEKAITAGQQVLHSYGDLSDAQLLHTYGFVDFGPPRAAGGAGGSAAGSSKGAAAAAEAFNPHNTCRVPWEVAAAACRAALSTASHGDKEELRGFDSSIACKLALLVSTGLLPQQQSAPAGAASDAAPPPCFTVTERDPLPDSLLTALQLLLMSEDDVEELQQEHEQTRKKKKQKKGKQAGAGGSSSSAAAAGEGNEAAAVPPLSLGTELLEQDEDFAQVVALALIQVVDLCLKRYPTSFQEDTELLQRTSPSSADGSSSNSSSSAVGAERLRLAVLVRRGEKHVLQELKRQGLKKVLMGGQGGGEGEEGGMQEEEEEDDGSDEGESDDEGQE